MKLTRKLLIPTIAIFAAIILATLIYDTWDDSRTSLATEQDQVENLATSFQSRLDSLEQLATALATETANDINIQQAFSEQDRLTLTQLTLAPYQRLDEQFNIPQHQFHLPPATSFLRLHQIDRFGDDLSTFRQTVLVANREETTVSGLEIGRAGLGMRGVVPVFYRGNHIGSVEFGLNIDQALLADLKEQYGVDWQLLLLQEPTDVAIFEGATADNAVGPTDNLFLQASTLAEPFFADADTYTAVANGESILNHQIDVNDRLYNIYSTPLYDYSGKYIGVLEIIPDLTAFAEAQLKHTLTGVGISILSLLLAAVGIIYFTTTLLQPIGSLTETARAITSGERVISNVETNDEIGELSDAFNTMTSQMVSLIESLESRVEERTKALAASVEVSRSLSTILEPSQLFSEVVQQVNDTFAYYHTQIYLLNEEGSHLQMVGGTGDAGRRMLANGHNIEVGKGLVGHVAKTGDAVLVTDVTQAKDWLRNPLLPDTKAEIAVPIKLGDSMLGVLDVQDDEVDGLSSQDEELLQAIANQVAVAIRNAQIYERTEKQARREAVINNISQRLQSAPDVDTVLKIAAEEIGQALRANQADILLQRQSTKNGYNAN